jgi:iron(III) transport system ATP-binding protein
MYCGEDVRVAANISAEIAPAAVRIGQSAGNRMNQMARIDMRNGAEVARPGAPAGSHTSALVVDRIRQTYGAVTALDEVSFALAKGEILALVGHSGSGKSTLLRVAAGLERPASGRVLVDGREVCGGATFVPPERRGVGLMFQDYALFPHMTVLDNVRFGLGRHPRSEADRIARHALEGVGLSAHAGDYPHALSGGEQQRVALARALAPEPSVLLMDEPFSNLDRRTRDMVRDETITVLRRNHATAILVTHDAEEAMRLADRIVLLRTGRVVQSGTAEELYRRPASLFVARFFSEFDEIESEVAGGRADSLLGAFPANGIAEGTKATICIRPNAIHLTKPGSGVAARVISRRFLGETDLLHVGVAGLPRALHVRVPAEILAGDGDVIGIDVARDGVMVFPAENGVRPHRTE